MTAARSFSYVLPLRRASPIAGTEQLGEYLEELVGWCDDVIVVDGSEPGVFAAHAEILPASIRHVEPDPRHRCLMGKVAGVLTGVDVARYDRVVVADDDVRYDRDGLLEVVALLSDHDLVRPQNFFEPLPWHAIWDTARTLLNRGAAGADFPGTLGVRRSTLLAAGGYDGDVMFENLELIRTIRAHGGTISTPLDLYVARRPPDARYFLSQRVRQAYDDFAIPGRMLLWLAIAPATVLARRHRRRLLGAGGTLAVALAERGRRRAGGAARFPVLSSLLAPGWLAERALCSWLALAQLLIFGGVRYRGGVIRVAAHSER